MPGREKIFQVGTITYADPVDALVDRRFRGRPMHRAEDTGAYAVGKIVEKLGSKLVRSKQEYLPAGSGVDSQLEWAGLCFQLEEDLFVTLVAKGSSMPRNRSGAEEYKVTVTAQTPQAAASVLCELRRDFFESLDQQEPAFFILTGGRRAQRAPLEITHLLDPLRLALHYGDDFPTNDFLRNLNEPGVSILRGETGTGKTSFLRHCMCALARTHRFYFVPVDNFGLLASGSLTEFWKAEERDYPSVSKVLVLEDAETMLADREHQKRSPVATLLNLADGLMTQLVKSHLVCTINCKVEEVDKALLRPGRLRFFRTLERIPRERALRIAQHYHLTLPDNADFTLADIFASSDFVKNTAGAFKQKAPVGFIP